MPETVLEVKHLVKRFGGVMAVDDISFRVEKGGPTLIALGLNGRYVLAGRWFFYAMYKKSKATGQFARNE